MNNFASGQHPDVMRMIVEVLSHYAQIESAILFGSRARGTFRANSDFDIAVSGVTNERDVEHIKMILDEIPLPYKFDVVSTSLSKSPLLQDRIQSEGIVIYER